MSDIAQLIHSRLDPSIGATVISRRPLRYSAGSDAALDRPDHVRAGSSLAWLGEQLVVVQDDTNFIALIDPLGQRVMAVPLPKGHDGMRQFGDSRGNKQWKLDLEACFCVETSAGATLVALGSGSSSEREFVVVAQGLEDEQPNIRLFRAHTLYEHLRATTAFSGSELNVEGAAVVGVNLRLFQRGNGAFRDGREPCNAFGDLSLEEFLTYLHGDPERSIAPELSDVVRCELGDVDGSRLTFTDASVSADQRVYYVAAAESSPDAVHDGPVVGAAIGVFERGAGRWAFIRDQAGDVVIEKPEGLVLHRSEERKAYAVLDADDENRPSELLEIALTGPW